MSSPFKNLAVLSIIILLFPPSSFATRIRIRNNCTYTVWPAAVPGGGRELSPGQAYDLSNTVAGPGRVWARTGCEFGPDGRGKCQSGDCGGLLECRGNGRPPNTVAGYSLAGRSGGGPDSFHVSVGEGFNVPLWFGSECGEAVDCVGDVNGLCPMELRDPEGCNNPCTVFGNAQFCCTLGSECDPTSYSMFFKDLCPDAFTYPSDLGKRSTCRSGTNYEIVFCPSNITPLQPSELSEYVGVCYSPRGNIPDAQVIALYEQYNVPRMRIYEPNQAILKALNGTDTELMLGLPNIDVPKMASSQADADAWVKNNVLNYADVKFKYVVVGSEMNGTNLTHLAPAMRNIQAAISSHGLSDKIKVSTCIDGVFLGASFPPSVSAFRSDREQFMKFLTSFLVNNSSPLLVTIYPYFTYVANPGAVSVDYALFRDRETVVQDGDLIYRNLFDAMLDGFYSALERLGGKSVEIVVAETSWPSFGDKEDQTEEYAWVYISNLVRHVKNGTPRRPGRPIETYVVAMFEYAEHMEISWPNKKPKL